MKKVLRTLLHVLEGAAFVVVMAALLGAIALAYVKANAQGLEYKLMDQPKIQGLKKVKPRKLVPPQAKSGTVIKIAIIDTGYDKTLLDPDGVELHLCAKGHYDFATETSIVNSGNKHGTIVGTIIAEGLQDVEYCAVIYQVQGLLGITAENLTRAVQMAKKEGVFAVNISLEGINHAQRERMALYDLGDKGTAIFVAAGNRHQNLDEVCNSYPGCYKIPNMQIVGASDESMEFRAAYSNYGSRITSWYRGDFTLGGVQMQGTSFAAPRALADYVSASSQRFAGH